MPNHIQRQVAVPNRLKVPNHKTFPCLTDVWQTLKRIIRAKLYACSICFCRMLSPIVYFLLGKMIILTNLHFTRGVVKRAEKWSYGGCQKMTRVWVRIMPQEVPHIACLILLLRNFLVLRYRLYTRCVSFKQFGFMIIADLPSISTMAHIFRSQKKKIISANFYAANHESF